MVAAIYDVHGNLPALEVVLEDARARGAQRYVLGGDYALFGGWPAETVARLRELEPAVWIRGNCDRWLGDAPDAPGGVQGAIAAFREALGDELADELAALPVEARRDDTLICHGAPGSDMRSFLPEPDDDEAELLRGVAEPRLLFGHTHLPFRRMAGSVELINPGSVGMPFDGDHRAAYALLHPDGRVEHRRLAYDRAAAIDQIREQWGDASWTDVMIRRLEQAQFVT